MPVDVNARINPGDIKFPPAEIALKSTEAIQKKFDALGGDKFQGPVEKKEIDVWYLKNGACICYNISLQKAFEIHGAIYKRWIALGGMKWGVPNTDETGTPDGVGRYNHFNNDAASIYWHPSTDAHGIWGDIRKKWAGMGWESSYLGYPTSDEVDFDGGRANSFQHGGIYWWGDTGAIDLRDVVVRFNGFHCAHVQNPSVNMPFGLNDNAPDEPYFVFGLTGPTTANTVRTSIYDKGDVKNGTSHAANPPLELYRGRPYGVHIVTTLMEHDYGDPQKIKDAIQGVVNQAHQAGLDAMGKIPFVGPELAKALGPFLGSLMPSVTNALNKLLGMGDDKLGMVLVTLTGRQLVMCAARTADWKPVPEITCRFEGPLISGDGAVYRPYFDVISA